MVMNAKETKIVRDRVLWNMDETLYLFLQLHFFYFTVRLFLTSLRAFGGPGEEPGCRCSEIHHLPIINPSSQRKMMNTGSHH